MREFVRDTLVDHGYRVFAAEAPSVALRLAEEHLEDIQVLLTDVIMPEMTGKELYERLSAEREDLRVLYMSGYQDQVVVGDTVLRKPFTIAVLTQSLREALDS